MIKSKLKNFKVVLGYKSVIALAFFAAGVGTTLTFAAIPDASGQISTCYRNTLLQKTFRVIDSEAGQECTGNETALNFNQAGPQGPEGPAGNTKNISFYTVGVTAPMNIGDTSATATAVCSDNADIALSGSYAFIGSNGFAGISPNNVDLTESTNLGIAYYGPTGIDHKEDWRVSVKFDPYTPAFTYGTQFVVMAICQHTSF